MIYSKIQHLRATLRFNVISMNWKYCKYLRKYKLIAEAAVPEWLFYRFWKTPREATPSPVLVQLQTLQFRENFPKFLEELFFM